MLTTRLFMLNTDLSTIPLVPLPEGYNFRFYQRGDELLWSQIETEAKEFDQVEDALTRFRTEFAGFEAELEECCLLLETKDQEPIGTAMAWSNPEFRDGSYGRLHWISLLPTYQGLGLARPLITRALKIMQERYTQGYLTTRQRNYKAIKLYFDYGFKPLVHNHDELVAWRNVEDILQLDLLNKVKR